MSGGSAVIATMPGAAAGHGPILFQDRWRFWRNEDIAFWFISQRMQPPVTTVLTFILIFCAVSLVDTQFGPAIAYTKWVLRPGLGASPCGGEPWPLEI